MKKRFLQYALKWQLSTIITVPLLHLFVNVFGWGFLPATLVFNFVGACIFFPIDVWIFRHSHQITTLKKSKDYLIPKDLSTNQMKSFFKQLFSDSNTINEKSVVGFMAFVMMSLFAVADIVTGFIGMPLLINEFIFNSFLIIVLGSFAIGSVDKYVNKKHEADSNSDKEPEA